MIFYMGHHAQTFALEKNFFIIVCAIFQLQETMLASIYGIQEPRHSQYLGFLGARILKGKYSDFKCKMKVLSAVFFVTDRDYRLLCFKIE